MEIYLLEKTKKKFVLEYLVRSCLQSQVPQSPSNRAVSVEEFHPAWQVVHISRSGHILDIKVLPAICQVPGVDVVDHSSDSLGINLLLIDQDFSLLGLPLHVIQNHPPQHWRPRERTLTSRDINYILDSYKLTAFLCNTVK